MAMPYGLNGNMGHDIMYNIISDKQLEELFLMKAKQHGQEHLIKLFIQQRPDLVLELMGLMETAYFMDSELELLPG